MILKQSTAVDVLIGPFVDKTDAATAETGESPSVKLSKNGQTMAAKNEATTPVSDADGYYNCQLDTTDTNTVGTVILTVAASANALPVRHEFQVIEEAVYDMLYGASATGYIANQAVNASQLGGQTVTAAGAVTVNAELGASATAMNNLETVFDTDFATNYNGTRNAWVTNFTDIIGTAPAVAGDAMTLAAGAITDASLAGNMEIVFDTDFATNYNTTRNAWVTNFTDTIGTGPATALSDIGLDHLISASVTGADVTDDSIIAKLVSKSATADWDDFDNVADSLQALEGHINNIASTGAAFHAAASGVTATVGTESSGLYTDTQQRDGVTHEHTDVGNALDIRYAFNVGTEGVAVELEYHALVNGNGDDLLVQVYDQLLDDGTWNTVATLAGVNTQTYTTDIEALFSKHTASNGDVEARFYAASGLGTATLKVDQIYIAYADALSGELAKVPKSDSNVTWNGTALASIEAEAVDALESLGLDHLVAVADADDPVDDSIMAKLASATGDWSLFVGSDDSLQALRDHIADGTNLSEAGGTGDHLTAINLPNQTMDIIGNITGNLSGSVGTVNGLAANVITAASMAADASAEITTAVLTTAMTEDYAANGAAPTLAQAQFAMHQMLMQFGIAGTSLTVRKLDDSTTAFIVTLDSASAPTDASRV